jgi:ligand-binding sensor protein
MQLTDILPLNKWVALEEEIAGRFGLDANVFDTDGVRISEFKNWVNDLCPAIKATDKGQAFICAVAHMNVAAQALQTRQAVIEECDAGLVKIVVPIFCKDRFVGAVGACGVRLDDGEVDTFLINKMTDIEEERATTLAQGISALSSEQAQTVVDFVQQKIANILAACNQC